MRGRLYPIVDADVRSAYPAGFSLLGCWTLLTAAELREVRATAELRRLANKAARGDLARLFDPNMYHRMSLCLAEVIFHGEPGPVELPGGPGDSPSLHVTGLRSEVPLPMTWPDVILSALLSGRVPEIVSATRLVPAGIERTRMLPLRDGIVVPADRDPVAAGVRLRSLVKDAGDERLPVQLRVFLNAMAWGLFARLDQRRVSGRRGERSRLIETPSEWSWPPISSTVPAVSRMWMALVERQVTDRGGAIITRDHTRWVRDSRLSCRRQS